MPTSLTKSLKRHSAAPLPTRSATANALCAPGLHSCEGLGRSVALQPRSPSLLSSGVFFYGHPRVLAGSVTVVCDFKLQTPTRPEDCCEHGNSNHLVQSASHPGCLESNAAQRACRGGHPFPRCADANETTTSQDADPHQTVGSTDSLIRGIGCKRKVSHWRYHARYIKLGKVALQTFHLTCHPCPFGAADCAADCAAGNGDHCEQTRFMWMRTIRHDLWRHRHLLPLSIHQL